MQIILQFKYQSQFIQLKWVQTITIFVSDLLFDDDFYHV